jgi:tetratricopeptide (TPR) repeat protein
VESVGTTNCPQQELIDAFLARRLPAEQAVVLEAHFDQCDACRLLAFALAPDEQLRSDAHRIGRYVVLRQLGEGAMGIVYAARDPALRRDVAIKLLRGGPAPDAAVRLRREAQGLARLAHPHVVSIFDVGTQNDDVYLAMELVDGVSFATWLAERERPWREIVPILLQAAEGLAVAHAAGLVHRDIKPQNVMVTKEGRAKVVDFGLAHHAGAARTSSPEDFDDIAVRVTRTGTVVGTPAYSAPEVLDGKPGDTRSDVFSFCVMAFEALYGARPYDATTVATLREQVRGAVALPTMPRLPGVLRRMLLAGLREDPAARPATIAALLPALRSALLPRGKIAVAVGAGLAMIAGASTIAVRVAGGSAADPCAIDTARAPVVTAQHEQKIRTAFAATKRPYAETAADYVMKTLRAFPARWAGARRASCLATKVRGEQSDELFDLRVACLDERARGVTTMLGLLETADADLVERSADAVDAATGLAACEGGRELMSPMRPPSDPARAVRFASARTDLERADTLKYAGQTEQAGEIAKRVVAEADAIGHLALGARAARMYATTHSNDKDAQALFEDAMRRAEAAGDDGTRVEVGLQLVQVWASLGKHEETNKLFGDLDAIMARIGAPPDLAAKLAYQRGRIEIEQASYAEAEAWLRKARGLQVALDPLNPETLEVDNELALVVAELGRLDEGDRILAAALATAERRVGASHPVVNALHLARGQIASAADNYQLARDELTLAIAGFDTGEGSDKIQGAHARADLANILLKLGDHARAADSVTRSIATLEEILGPEHQDVGTARSYRAKVLAATGDGDGALAEYDHSIAILEKVVGADHPRVAGIVGERGALRVKQGKTAAGIADLERAHAIFAKTFDASHSMVVEAAAALAAARQQSKPPRR